MSDEQYRILEICNLCEEAKLTRKMKNIVNGNEINVCQDCFHEIWEKEDKP